MKKQITDRLVMARINRALLKKHGTTSIGPRRQLRKHRKTERYFETYGAYALWRIDGIEDTLCHPVVAHHINLEKMGREMGVIAEWETMTGYDKGQRESPAGP